MSWNDRLADWIGKSVTVTIVDQAGTDPVSPARSFILKKLRLTEEGTHLQFFLTDHQFVSVPIFDDGSTRLTEREFLSEDRASMLNYGVHL
ncbi:hypothetical protein O9H85_23220 [Paenibacillus filicis]|uniref:Uncharacterized protein n=1 Tax=Paenibacillus gyeongsangnamensis TaxID=3388067 RepID=A0ABT4QET3_9BACL|nr:hypothetical protein [Paenibacillus filicis]MCZ8515271.1 hypothetical protein [Paenibacillus filicis]